MPIPSYSVVYGILRTYAIVLLYKSEKQNARLLYDFVKLPEVSYSYLSITTRACTKTNLIALYEKVGMKKLAKKGSRGRCGCGIMV